MVCVAAAKAAETQFTYDAAGRLIGVDYGGGGALGYAYDAAGNILSESSNAAGSNPATADVSVKLEVAGVPVAGGRWVVRAAVTNAGPGVAHGVILRVVPPADTTVVRVSTTQGFVMSETGTVELDLGSISVGRPAVADIELRASRAGSVEIASTVSSRSVDPVPRDNTQVLAAVIARSVDLRITGVAGPDPLTVGAPLDYEFTIANQGTTEATQVRVVSQYPVGTVPRASGSSVGSTTVGADRMIAELGTLAPGASATVTLSMSVVAAGVLSSVTTVGAAEPDGDGGDNELVLAVRAESPTRIVTNANDDGPGSLRQAILDANAAPDRDLIAFEIPGDAVPTLEVQRGLPVITHPVVIDGFTQRAGLVELNFERTLDVSGFRVEAGGCVFRGLVINRVRFEPAMVFASGTGSVVEGCRIGVAPDGMRAQPNSDAIHIQRGSGGHRIGGPRRWQRNLLSGNTGISTVRLAASQDNLIQGNVIGLGIDGSTPVPNLSRAIVIEGSTCDVVADNVISGNGGTAIHVESGGGTRIVGNRIGVDASGREVRTNAAFGIHLSPLAGTKVTGVQIGGVLPGEANVIAGSQFSAIFASADHCRIVGNRIGVDVSGTIALANGFDSAGSDGVSIVGSHHAVGGGDPGEGNVIAGHTRNGIAIRGDRVRVQGNRVGTDATGTRALPNRFSGIAVTAGVGNEVGGPGVGQGNLLSGNLLDGIQLAGTAEGTRIIGNWIGTDITLTRSLSNRLGVSLFQGVTGTLIQGNVISGNGGQGIQITTTNAPGAVVTGNFIGTDGAGSTPVPNGRDGILIFRSSGNRVGPGNVISGNAGSGVDISRAPSVDNVVVGNLIGVGGDGVARVPNVANGVTLFETSRNRIGGVGSGEGNRIAFNGAQGVQVYADATTNNSVAVGNAILGNSIFANGGLGIELGGRADNAEGVGDGPDANDAGDADGGPNHRQNAPVLASADSGPGGVVIRGSLGSLPGGSYRIEVFGSDVPDPSGFGEGREFLGATEVALGGDGNGAFVIQVATLPTGMGRVSATATAPDGSTSEFSAAVVVGGRPEPVGPVLGGVIVAADGRFLFEMGTQAGFSYVVEASADLVEWREVLRRAGTGGRLTVEAGEVGSSPFRFFRIRVE